MTQTDPNRPPDSAAAPDRLRQRNPLRELNINERVTAFLAASSLFVGLGSLAVSYQSYKMASDSTDLKAAIRNLSALATQTKRQADATNAQLLAVKDQVAEAKHQTQAISEQTTAIKASSEAAVRMAGAQIESARAQARAATAAAASQRPAIALTDVTMSGFDGPVETAEPFKGRVKVNFNYQYTNVGGTPWELIDNAMVISIAAKLPDNPDYSVAQHLKGMGLTIPRGNFMNLVGSPSFAVAKEQADGIKAGRLHAFMYGIITYRAFETDHHFCYAYEVPIIGGHSARYLAAGGPAYHCDN